MPPKSFVHAAFRGISFAFLVACLSSLSSCDQEKAPTGSNHLDDTEQIEQGGASENGPPSDLTVRHAAWTMNTSYIDKAFKRGQVLEALGGGGVPVGTALYPIKFQDFPFPIYLSRDEFSDWRFTIGEKTTLYQVRIPLPPETEDAKKKREQEIRNKSEEDQMLQSVRRQAEEEANKRKEAEHLRKRQLEEETERKRSAEFSRLDGERIRRERAELAEANRLGAEERVKQREEQDRTLAREMGETRRKLGQGSEPSEKQEPDETAKEMPITPSPKEVPSEPKVSPEPDKVVRLAEAKAELAALESRIVAERQRFQLATDTINRLTNFKKTPVKEGSSAYHQCVEASRVIQNVEQKAPGMTAEKTRLSTLITELERN